MAVIIASSKDLVANTISVIDKDKVIYVQELFLSNLDAVDHIVGLPAETWNSLQTLAEAIYSDTMKASSLKPTISYVNTQVDTILAKC